MNHGRRPAASAFFNSLLVVGEPKFHVAIMTFDKVRGRLGGDDADNIPFFYEGFAARIRSAKRGTKALYG